MSLPDYDGAIRIGELEDHGSRKVEAFTVVGSKRVRFGTQSPSSPELDGDTGPGSPTVRGGYRSWVVFIECGPGAVVARQWNAWSLKSAAAVG
jgi:hypothetical protein